MDYRVSYEHSLKNAPDEFIVHVPSQLVGDIPANVPRVLLPEYIADLILKRSPQIGKIRYLRILYEDIQLTPKREHADLEVRLPGVSARVRHLGQQTARMGHSTRRRESLTIRTHGVNRFTGCLKTTTARSNCSKPIRL
jgi:hypothetical protein